MFHASIPLTYEDYIFESIIFVINKLPSTPTGSVSPFELLFSQKANYNFLYVLGCACYPLLRSYTHHKLEPRSAQCIFLGYSTIHKGYMCLNTSFDRIYVSKHVAFDDTTLTFQSLQQTSSLANELPHNKSITGTLKNLPSALVPEPLDTNNLVSNCEISPSIPQTSLNSYHRLVTQS
jgi:hypothetical protein